MATVIKGYTFISGETVEPADMHQLVDAATVTFTTADDTDNSTLEVSGNKFRIKDAGVTNAKLATGIDASKITTGEMSGARLVDDSVTNDKLSLAANAGEIKKALNADNNPPIFACRAWVNFDGTASASIGGDYSRTGTTLTITTTNPHGEKVGNRVYINATSGALVSDEVTVASIVSDTQFTATSVTSGSASGTMTVRRSLIRASGNVANVAKLDTGKYAINFTTAMPDANYCVANGSGDTGGSAFIGNISPSTATTSNRFVFFTVTSAGSISDRDTCMLAFFR
jgi:hypothetical protein